MNEPKQVVFYSAKQADADQRFLEKQRRRAEYRKYLSIIIMLTILIGVLTVVMGLLQAPVPTLISAVPVLNDVRYASDSDHSRYESELTLWANKRHCATKHDRGLV